MGSAQHQESAFFYFNPYALSPARPQGLCWACGVSFILQVPAICSTIILFIGGRGILVLQLFWYKQLRFLPVNSEKVVCYILYTDLPRLRHRGSFRCTFLDCLKQHFDIWSLHRFTCQIFRDKHVKAESYEFRGCYATVVQGGDLGGIRLKRQVFLLMN